MLVMIKSAPGTLSAKRGIRVARDISADIVLVGDAVLFAEKGRLEDFCGTAHVLAGDLKSHAAGELEKGARVIDADELSRMIEAEAGVIGAF